MARPLKTGLTYFPLDTDFDQDDKVVIIIGKYGMEGLGVLIKLMMELYKKGYFYNWTEREQIVFSSRINVDINLVNDIVNDCIKWGFFNKNMFEQFEILTSKGFQERYLFATNRRLGCEIKEEHKLTEVEQKEVKRQEPKKEKPKKEPKPKDTEKEDQLQKEFEVFWNEYPRKVGKKPALQKFKSQRKEYTFDDIMKGVMSYKEKCKVEGTEIQYIKHPSTFLNQEMFAEIHEINVSNKPKFQPKPKGGQIGEIIINDSE